MSGLFVDVRAESASAARQQALAEARVEGFNRLLRRLTRRSDHALLPVLGSEEIESLVTSFQVEGEKTAPDRYIASLAMQYDAASVREILSLNEITFTESRALPVLIVPVLTEGSVSEIWTAPNPWMDAWASVDAAQHLIPPIAPFGDIEDVVLLTADQALRGEAGAIGALAARYNAETAIVAEAVHQADQATGKRLLTVKVRSVGPDSYPGFTLSFEGRLDGDATDFMTQVADQVLNELEEGWKVTTIESFSEEFQLTALVPFTGLQDWLDISSRLRGVNLVRAQEVSALTVRDAVIIVTHVGEPDLLNRSMARAGLQMLAQPDGFWIISRLDAAQ